MKKKIKIIIIVLIPIILAASAFVYKAYTRKPKTALDLPADYKITAESLFNEFNNNETEALNKYTDKVIEVKGIVETINQNGNETDVVLQTPDPLTAINVQLLPEMKNKLNQIKQGEEVTLKAILKGKLSDIELNRGAILEQ
jgi:flagellar basal body-associated protein FliL